LPVPASRLKCFLGVVAIGTILLASPRARAADDVIRIGVLDFFSSANGEAVGLGSVEAARMAAEDAGGTVAGKRIEIVQSDHQGKPDIGAAAARHWFDVDGVDAIVSVPNSAVALALIDIAKTRDKVLLFSSAGSSDITGRACAPSNVVEWTFDTYALANSSVRALVSEGADRWFFVTADYALGKSLERDARSVLSTVGGQAIGTVSVPMDNADFSSFLITAQSSGARVIALANAATDTVNSIKQAHEFNIGTGSQKLAALLFDITDANGIGLQTAQGLYFVNAFYWDRDEPARAWSRRFFARMNRMPTMFQAGTYSAVKHYLEAIAVVGTTGSGSRVIAEMRKAPVNDVFTRDGHMREDGTMVHDMYLMQVKSPAEQHYPWDYFRIVRRIPGAEAYRSMAESACPPDRRVP
jgi:branched-chain amino acid transport system substrate-binding protein